MGDSSFLDSAKRCVGSLLSTLKHLPGALKGLPMVLLGLVTRPWDWAKRNPGRALTRSLVAVPLTLITIKGLQALGVAVIPALPIGLAALFSIAALRDRWKAKVLELVGAVVISIVTLVGFNVVTDALFGGSESTSASEIVLGLLVAFVVFAFSSYVYLRHRGHWTVCASLVAAPLVAFAVIFVTPFVYAWATEDDERKDVPKAEAVPSELDLFIVAERPPESVEPILDDVPDTRALKVRYVVGFAGRDDVRWTYAGTDERQALKELAGVGTAAEKPPRPRPGADRLLVLVVDGTPPVVKDPAKLSEIETEPDVQRWEAVARATRLEGVPRYALVQSTDAKRLARWRRRIRDVSLQRFGSRTITDAAFRLAVSSPRATEDFLLAQRHRPVLLFDAEEQVPRPLSIEGLFADRAIRQCPLRGNCGKPLTDPAQLENGDTRLEIDRPKSKKLRAQAAAELRQLKQAAATAPPSSKSAAGAAPEGTPPAATPSVVPGKPLSTIYVRTTSRVINDRGLLYLDYWWYLPDNPAKAGSGAFCGAGLVIPGITCFNHEGDWEGVTVVVEHIRDGEPVTDPQPVAVHYAEHASIVRYEWKQLQQRWDRKKDELAKLTIGAGDVTQRPLVFVARGTHASYPLPCPPPRPGEKKCRQVAVSAEEQPQTGTLPWAGNGASTCGEQSLCLTPIPTISQGTQPALWNAFQGPWGKARCVLKYCNSTTPPSSPGKQRRYKRPWACSGTFDLLKPKATFEKNAGCLGD